MRGYLGGSWSRAAMKMWEQNGNNKPQTPPKTVLHDMGKGWKNQPHHVSWIALQADRPCGFFCWEESYPASNQLF
jgi:hypothetical protein